MFGTYLCPKCGKETLATVPMGHDLVGVNNHNGVHVLHNADSSSQCFCINCKCDFYSYSKKA